jgi:cytochrome c553
MTMKLSVPLLIAIAFAAAGVGNAQPSGADLRAACSADLQKFCSNLQPGEKPMKCMRAHLDELSDACKSAIAQARAARQAGKGESDEAAPQGGGPPPQGGGNSTGP